MNKIHEKSFEKFEAFLKANLITENTVAHARQMKGR
jgi:hypothetical protein